ncbi:hypothetical protein CEXT_720461 [Caerostris extrusa]|uniref:Uncharacterized protein n=1 Tax=Caerostris extrusa TaxID=172846 RepID=A0AAV4NB91_CAEEX|nr:hypothetical protein CEXT_720461 [Caerostris extrusa]
MQATVPPRRSDAEEDSWPGDAQLGSTSDPMKSTSKPLTTSWSSMASWKNEPTHMGTCPESSLDASSFPMMSSLIL